MIERFKSLIKRRPKTTTWILVVSTITMVFQILEWSRAGG